MTRLEELKARRAEMGRQWSRCKVDTPSGLSIVVESERMTALGSELMRVSDEIRRLEGLAESGEA